jgi:hypothetical protein
MAEERAKRAVGQSAEANPRKLNENSPDSAEAGDTPGNRTATGPDEPAPAGGTEQPKNDRRRRGDLQKRL